MAENNENLNAETAGEEVKKLALTTHVEPKGACVRHITVRVARSDVDRYLDQDYSELVKTAFVPGFRVGHAPRRLVEARFKEDVSDRVKMNLIMDSLGQVNEEQDLAPISEPDLDPESVQLPEDGDLVYEYDQEVRPEFTVPDWKGLKIEKPVREITDADVTESLQNVLARYAHLDTKDGEAVLGDYVNVAMKFTHEGKTLSQADDEVIRLRPILTFRDGKIENFGELLAGKKAGDEVVGAATLSEDAPNYGLRGQKIDVAITVKEVKRLVLPELTKAFLEEIGFESEDELFKAIHTRLDRQLEYQQQQSARRQITEQLAVGADWELPPELLRRQTERELARFVMELQRSGFDDQQILSYENVLRQNQSKATATSLREHFIFEKIAENENIEDTPEDYDLEIALMGYQSGESPRRIRARLEKTGRMDVLRNQIIERKVIEKILAAATFEEKPYQPEPVDAEALGITVGGEEEEPKKEEKTDAEA
ncbi:MAG: trigger factor [Thermoguttaceae bacterium]|nr:trigger factor [Thermoguttaceae bacterium]